VGSRRLPGSGSPERRAALAQDLQGALERGEIGVHYQEQFGPDGEPCGVEALARWTSPRWGSVTPTEFIPLCEDDDLIVPVGTWVLREAVTQLARWRAAGLPYARVAVNVSPVQFLRPDFERVVRAALHDSGLPPACLELELGEAFVASHQSVITQRLHALRGLGVRIVLDDFGTGGSGLAALMQVPLDGLKIDRQFLRDDTSAPLHEGRGVTASVAMAHALGLDVVLEGVETPAHLALGAPDRVRTHAGLPAGPSTPGRGDRHGPRRAALRRATRRKVAPHGRCSRLTACPPHRLPGCKPPSTACVTPCAPVTCRWTAG